MHLLHSTKKSQNQKTPRQPGQKDKLEHLFLCVRDICQGGTSTNGHVIKRLGNVRSPTRPVRAQAPNGGDRPSTPKMGDNPALVHQKQLDQDGLDHLYRSVGVRSERGKSTPKLLIKRMCTVRPFPHRFCNDLFAALWQRMDNQAPRTNKSSRIRTFMDPAKVGPRWTGTISSWRLR